MAAPAASSKLHGAAAPPRLLAPGRARDALVFASGVFAAVLVLLGSSASVLAPGMSSSVLVASPVPGPEDGPPTFYDDPDLSYSIDGRRVTGWDAKREHWLRSRGLLHRGSPETKVVMVSGSQPEPCTGEAGDHLMLRLLKNKLDYCRLHGIHLLYNRDFLHPATAGNWAKLPILRAAMLAHPDAEWLWWVDSDAVLTDMDFSLPLATKYAAYNLVAYGWPEKIKKKSWLGINNGVLLLRNCQWSLDLVDEWARMGPAFPEAHARFGKLAMETLSDKKDPWFDDQTGLVYLLLTNWDRLGDKVHVETEYYLQSYWLGMVDQLDAIAARYEAVERRRSSSPAAARALRRRHAEREHLRYAAARNAAVRGVVPGPAGGGYGGWRRPLITHFMGCQPCNGKQNPMYSKKSCDEGIRRALAFADDQVLRVYGFRHASLLNDTVLPLPFDYPAATATVERDS
ncbi:hypothetical protein HU200_038271 [Digitaria exilis]|uniref:Uncharacterized protein n=1 Tax=Digitaria exilis TaxID=1010633 RepID=A0A835EKL7_9POAL|nr:hypothetical protein HU200_038271 [Digitaria exilis]